MAIGAVTAVVVRWGKVRMDRTQSWVGFVFVDQSMTMVQWDTKTERGMESALKGVKGVKGVKENEKYALVLFHTFSFGPRKVEDHDGAAALCLYDSMSMTARNRTRRDVVRVFLSSRRPESAHILFFTFPPFSLPAFLDGCLHACM